MELKFSRTGLRSRGRGTGEPGRTGDPRQDVTVHISLPAASKQDALAGEHERGPADGKNRADPQRSPSPAGAVDEGALLAWIQSGEADALHVFFQQFHPRIHRWCTAELGDPRDADEAAGQVVRVVARTRLLGVRRLYPHVRKTALDACDAVARARGMSAGGQPVDDLPAQLQYEDADTIVPPHLGGRRMVPPPVDRQSRPRYIPRFSS